ncbi:hypothetical protein Peur_002206 [Populus x canadensis]
MILNKQLKRIIQRVSKRCFNGGREKHSEACMCYLLLLHCDTGVAPSAGPKRRLLLDMRGAAFILHFPYRVKNVFLTTLTGGLCLLPVAGAIDGTVLVRELRRERKRE